MSCTVFFRKGRASAGLLRVGSAISASASPTYEKGITALKSAVLQLTACASILICVVQPGAALGASAPTDKSSGDRPETGLQGQTTVEDIMSGRSQEPHYKGTRLVGHTDLWNRGANLQLSWIDSCAYVSTLKASSPQGANGKSELFLKPPAGVAVIDVSKPRSPTPVKLLRDRGSIDAVETMHAVTAADRKILVAGAYSGGLPGMSGEDAAWLSIYDASDCKNPKLMSEFKWPVNVHMVTVSPNGRRVYGTEIMPGLATGKGGILVLDITDMAHPRYLGKFGATRPDGTTRQFTTHEVSLSADEKRIYAAVYGSETGDVDSTKDGSVYVLDNSDIVEGRDDIHLRLIGEAQHGGWHSVVPANIDGEPHLVGASELGGCPGTWPKIINIADETRPRIVGEFKLQMNQTENCKGGILLKTGQDPIGTIASHFNDVDDATHTRLGLFPFMAGGLRIVDLRDPSNPAEVAYFKPGARPGTVLNARGVHWLRLGYNDQATDACMSHVRYVPETGHIWFACASSGFYVIELTPEIRSSLDLPKVVARIP